jgi:hypothetical protein
MFAVAFRTTNALQSREEAANLGCEGTHQRAYTAGHARGTEPRSVEIACNKEFAAEVVFEVDLRTSSR